MSMQTNFYVDRTEKVSLFIFKTILCLFKLAFIYLRSKQAAIDANAIFTKAPSVWVIVSELGLFLRSRPNFFHFTHGHICL